MNRTSYKKCSQRVARRTVSDEGSLGTLIRHIAKSTMIAIGIGACLLLVFSLALYFSPDPTPMIRPFGWIAAALTAFAGGFTASRIHGHGALICGLINGSVLTALMLLLALPCAHQASSYSAIVSCLLHVAFFAFSLAGAYLGLRRVPQKKKRKR